jgi:hypothetical protein
MRSLFIESIAVILSAANNRDPIVGPHSKKPEIFRCAQDDTLFESNSPDRGIQPSKPIMNNEQPTDKARSSRRLKIMKNDQTIYGILAGSEEKGRDVMETVVYATCILSVVAAIFQFIGQPTADPFAGFYPAAQPVPVVSHALQGVSETKS